MDRTSSSAYSSHSAAPQTTAAGSPPILNAADRDEYTQLLARFPEQLRDSIEEVFPEHEELAAFHQDFVDKGLPFEHKGLVACLVGKARMEKLVAQRRILFLPLKTERSQAPDGATPLHEAILIWDEVLVRELLRKGAAPGDVLRPKQRLIEVMAMEAVAARLDRAVESHKKFLGEEFTNTVEQAVFEELTPSLVTEELHKSRDHAEGVRATILAAHAGENALTLAISYGAPMAVIALLMEHCARHCRALPNQADGNGNLPLTLAAANGEIAVVRLLLQSGAPIDIDALNGSGHSALMEAARSGHADIVELLLEHGANACQENAQGRTARELAAIREHTDAFKALADWEMGQQKSAQGENLEAKLAADLRAAAARGNTSVLEAVHAKLGQCIEAAIRDLARLDEAAQKPLREALQQKLRAALQEALREALRKKGNTAAIAWLIQQGANPNLADDQGLLPEALASDRDNLEALMSAICPGKADGLDAKRRQGLLHRAAQLGSMLCLRQALDSGVDIDTPHPDTGMTALASAVARADFDLVALLLQRGAHTCVGIAADTDEATALAGKSALAIAASLDGEKERKKMLRFLIGHHPAPYTEAAQSKLLLHIALEQDRPELLARLIRDGQVDFDAYAAKPKSLLMTVAECDSPELMRALLSDPAPIRRLLNAANGDADALLKSIAEDKDGDTKIFEIVLEACNVSPHDDEVQKLKRLCWAVKADSRASCELMLKQGKLQLEPATPRTRNPLTIALRHGRFKLIPLLLEHGAHACTLTPRDPEGRGAHKSALQVAIESGAWEALPILMDNDPHLPNELTAILPALLKKIDAYGFDPEIRPRLPCGVIACLLRHTEGMPMPARTLRALLFLAAKSGDADAIAALLKRGVDPTLPDASGAKALEVLLNCSTSDKTLEYACLLLEGQATAPIAADPLEACEYFHLPGYTFDTKKRLLAALTSERIDAEQKISLMSTLLLSRRLFRGDFEFSAMVTLHARAVREALMPIAKSIYAKSPERILSATLKYAMEIAEQSDDKLKVQFVKLCEQVWNV